MLAAYSMVLSQNAQWHCHNHIMDNYGVLGGHAPRPHQVNETSKADFTSTVIPIGLYYSTELADM